MKLIESNSLLPEQLQMFVSAETRKFRIALCNACEHAKPLPLVKHRTCEKCGCLVELKTTLKSVACPIGKWQESTSNYQQEPA